MPICKKCEIKFPNLIPHNGKLVACNKRRFCPSCSPFGSKNTRDITKPKTDAYANHRRHVTNWQKKARTERKAKIVEIMGGCCSKCGYKKCVAALEFHHIDGNNKDFSLSNKGWFSSFQRLLEESKKCILVCANCHREIHWEAKCKESPRLIETQEEVVQLDQPPPS